MPAPKYQIGNDVVARDGTKARVVGTYDFGEDALPLYDIQTEKGDIREHVEEAFLAEVPAPQAAEAPKKGKAADAGAAPAPIQAGGEDRAN